ncbi:MAG: thioredoxin family protein [Thermonemataceae bacterium]|nr:thioredoxin family protein [Thermonemataceae bacterium]
MLSLENTQTILEKESVVAFYFTTYECNVADAMQPKLLEMFAKEYPKIHFLEINTYENPDISAHYQVFTVPTLLVFFEGKESLRKARNFSVAEVQKDLERPYQLLFS